MAERKIIQGEPGEVWTNNTPRVLFQFHVSGRNTCGACYQYEGQIGSRWPIQLHHGCRCSQTPIAPGMQAPRPFADFRQIIDDLPHAQQVSAVGGAVYRLLKEGVVTWAEVVTKFRVRTLQEVVALNKISLKTMLQAGVKPNVAERAFETTHTAEHEFVRAHRERQLAELKRAGASHEALVDALTRGLTGRVTIVGPGGTQSMAPFVARRGGDLLAAELAAMFPPKPPEPPEPPKAPPEPPQGPPAGPAPPQAPPPVPAAPAGPGFPAKKISKPRVPKPKKDKAFTSHDLGQSKARVRIQEGARKTVKEVFGRSLTPKKLASLAGAPDDAQVIVGAYGGEISLTVHHPQIDSMQRTIRKQGGKIIIHNDIFRIKEEFQQNAGKIGLKAFAREAQNAQAEGVSHIETNAFRVKGDINPTTGKERWSGYYVWPRYGYDGPIPEYSVKGLARWRELPAHLQGVTNVSELMVDPVGRKWWQQHGDAINVVFDLKPDSYSMRTLNSYLQETIPAVKKK